MRRRIISPFDAPINPLISGKAGSKDPRGFVSGNIPGQQADIQQQSRSRAELELRQPPHYANEFRQRQGFDNVSRTVPTRVNFIPWQVRQTAITTPLLLVPRNPNRLALLLQGGNFGNVLIFFGAPTTSQAAFFLPTGQHLLFTGDVVPINDIYAVTDNAIGLLPCNILAYEGIDAIEGNQQ